MRDDREAFGLDPRAREREPKRTRRATEQRRPKPGSQKKTRASIATAGTSRIGGPPTLSAIRTSRQKTAVGSDVDTVQTSENGRAGSVVVETVRTPETAVGSAIIDTTRASGDARDERMTRAPSPRVIAAHPTRRPLPRTIVRRGQNIDDVWITEEMARVEQACRHAPSRAGRSARTEPRWRVQNRYDA